MAENKGQPDKHPQSNPEIRRGEVKGDVAFGEHLPFEVKMQRETPPDPPPPPPKRQQ